MKKIITVSILFLALGFSQNSYVNKNDQVRLAPRMLNYQGYLTDTLGNPITNPSVSMIFAIFDAVSSGTQKWTETQSTVSVNKGIFSVLLGSVTPVPDSVFAASTNRWLELSVAGQTLAPRTRIVSVPFAYTATYSDTAVYARNSAPDNDWTLIGNVLYVADNYGLAKPGDSLYGADNYSHVNWGFACTTGTSGANLVYCTVGGGAYNKAGGYASVVAGGYNNVAGATCATVAGGEYNAASNAYTTIAGGSGNIASEEYATVSGGEMNTASSYYTTVAGGESNTASVYSASVGGGSSNTASNYFATVGGGYNNTAGGYGGTVGGGYANTDQGVNCGIFAGSFNQTGDAATDSGAVVAGGSYNSVTGKFSSIDGGRGNSVAANYSSIIGGYADTIFANAHYSSLFGINANLTQDSTIMLDVPHVWFGTEATGYEFPRQRGTNGQVMVTNASGQMNWATVSGGADNDWVFLVSDGADTTLQMGGRWGLVRMGNTLYGNADSTHVNFGLASATGASGQNYKYCTVGGGALNTAGNTAATVAGGYGNTASADFTAIGGGFCNTASNYRATVAGGYLNTASGSYATVGGGYADTASGNFATVGGGWHNYATNERATVAGGHYNFATGSYSTVAGGYNNMAYGFGTTVAGGANNTVSDNYATVAGGFYDTVKTIFGGVLSGYSNLAGDVTTDTGAVVCGGWDNSAIGKYSFVGGGINNTASGNNATVGGGSYNYNAGDYSIIAGGYADTIFANAHYSSLFGINANLTQDSTFMLDIPHVWFGTEATGYEFPRQRGANGQVMITNGSGQLSWATAAASDTDWIITGSNMYSGVSGNVGIGTATPLNKLDVNGVICGGTNDTVYGIYGSVLSGYGNLAGNAAVDTSAIIAGGWNNSATTKFAFVGGGYNNIVNGNYGTVAGGRYNTSYLYATVAGGDSNTAGSSWATVSGGRYNNASSNYATVAGGDSNTSSGFSYATVSGGHGNRAYGNYAIVGGGRSDTVEAHYGGVFSGYSNVAGNMVGDTAATVVGGRDNSATGKYAFVGGGCENTASTNYSIIGGGYNNIASGTYAVVAGGGYNIASYAFAVVAGGDSNVAMGNWSTVGGGHLDSVEAPYGGALSGYKNRGGDSWIDTAAIVAGGWQNGAMAKYSFVGGGIADTANGVLSTVTGGYRNTSDSMCATVGGGASNTASHNYATVAGGHLNTANGLRTSIGGGYSNYASGVYSTIPGGYNNTASGNMSFAAGTNANAAHKGCFVWADSSSGSSFSSTIANQFRIRAVGGIDLTGNVAIRNTAGTIVVELGEGLDYAEGFDVHDKGKISPGAVLAIDPENPGNLKISDRPYDTKVAGITAGAKKLGSGVRLGNGQFDCDVALAGRVYCNVDATDAGVNPGDLLTTSTTPGYAMKVIDYARARGAILGKAMQKLDQGKKGQILVLVTLQ